MPDTGLSTLQKLICGFSTHKADTSTYSVSPTTNIQGIFSLQSNHKPVLWQNNTTNIKLPFLLTGNNVTFLTHLTPTPVPSARLQQKELCRNQCTFISHKPESSKNFFFSNQPHSISSLKTNLYSFILLVKVCQDSFGFILHLLLHPR